ncbi:DUF6946 family protein [Thermodesulfobacteriota bacterium]
MKKHINRKSNIYIPTKSAEDWKDLLAEPEKQWKTGYSAKALAYCWQEAEGFPDSINKVFTETTYPIFKGITPLIILPEYQVPLLGGSRPSQSDIFVLAYSNEGLITIAVEGKVEETFGPTLSEWLKKSSEGKRVRLEFIREQLELTEESLDNIRYQLLHRTASALIEAKWFHASSTVMLIHSFSQDKTWFDDYNEFVMLFDKIGKPESVTFIGKKNGIDLYCAWVTGEEKYLTV